MPSSPEPLLLPGDAPEVFDLFDAVLDERADDGMRNLLRQRCAEDPAVRAAYVAYVGIHAELMWQQRGSLIAASDRSMQQAAQHHRDRRTSATLAMPATPVVPTTPSRRFPILRLALAASLLIAVVAFIVVPTVVPRPPAAAAVAATITRSFDAEWADDRAHAIGAQLGVGRHVLQFGMVDLVLVNGVTLTLHAPCALELTGENRVGLSLGLLTAQVPVAARGFTVQVPQGSVVDHGTVFTTLVEADGGAEVHVLRGEVAVSLTSASPSGSAITQVVTAGQALRRTGPDGPAAATAFDPTLGALRLGRHGIARTSFAVRLSEPAPASVNPGALESDSHIVLIRERQALTTATAMKVVVPARTDGSASEQIVTLPAGTRVDSYLLHFDPVGAPSQAVQVIGSVTFDQPVVGVFAIDPHLDRSQTIFRHPTMAYHDRDLRQGMEAQDSFTLSADGRTIRVLMSVREQQSDQLRVLVANPE